MKIKKNWKKLRACPSCGHFSIFAPAFVQIHLIVSPVTSTRPFDVSTWVHDAIMTQKMSITKKMKKWHFCPICCHFPIFGQIQIIVSAVTPTGHFDVSTWGHDNIVTQKFWSRCSHIICPCVRASVRASVRP